MADDVSDLQPAAVATELVAADTDDEHGTEGTPVYATKLGDSVIDVANLHVEFPTVLGVGRALNGVNYRIPAGKVLGVVGESGSG